MRRVYLQVDRLSIDALVVSCYPGSLCLDLPFYLGKVIKSPPGYMMELSPFLLSSYTSGSMWDVDFIIGGLVVSLAGKIYELKNERSSSDDAASSRKEISADDVLEY